MGLPAPFTVVTDARTEPKKSTDVGMAAAVTEDAAEVPRSRRFISAPKRARSNLVPTSQHSFLTWMKEAERMVRAKRAQIAEITPANAIVVDQITHHSL